MVPLDLINNIFIETQSIFVLRYGGVHGTRDSERRGRRA